MTDEPRIQPPICHVRSSGSGRVCGKKFCVVIISYLIMDGRLGIDVSFVMVSISKARLNLFLNITIGFQEWGSSVNEELLLRNTVDQALWYTLLRGR